MNIKTPNGEDTKTPSGKITNGKILIGVVFQRAAGKLLRDTDQQDYQWKDRRW